MKKIAIIGGGATGYFLAANLNKETGNQTVLFEQAQIPLQKVRVSGGGRCNVTHACFNPKDLINFYPRGRKELLSVFHQFQPKDTMKWFEDRKIPLKIEEDNRIFPSSNSSLSIIECLLKETERNGVTVNLGENISAIKKEKDYFIIKSKTKEYQFEKVVVCTGSNLHFWQILSSLGHKIVPNVPSLFTFKCKDNRINDLMGLSFEQVELEILNLKLNAEGPLLITHWGFSGPVILKTSAWGALALHAAKYNFDLKINFLAQSTEETLQFLLKKKIEDAKKQLDKNNPFSIPKRFWQNILKHCEIPYEMTYADVPKKKLNKLAIELTQAVYKIDGKSTFKDEFVTAGGVDLKEINFKSMESKVVPNLYLAGEVLNIDAITGGFNFQACWSEAFIISNHLNNS